jgi:hypothetical protein
METFIDPVPLHPEPIFAEQDHLGDVLRIVIPQMPIPDESTPWEAILDFKSDPETRDQFTRFRRWTNVLAQEPKEIEELDTKLRWMLYDYQKQMELHKMKTCQNVLELFVKATVDILANLPTMLVGLPTIAFGVRKARYALMEADSTAPGKEVAYICRSHEQFSDNACA